MRHEIVHMVGHENGAELPTGEVKSMRTRCGRTIDHPVVEGMPSRYSLVASNGNLFQCTTREKLVTCVKCVNLVTTGSIHVKPSRPAKPQKRTVAHAHASDARAVGRNPVGRPKGGRLRVESNDLG